MIQRIKPIQFCRLCTKSFIERLLFDSILCSLCNSTVRFVFQLINLLGEDRELKKNQRKSPASFRRKENENKLVDSGEGTFSFLSKLTQFHQKKKILCLS